MFKRCPMRTLELGECGADDAFDTAVDKHHRKLRLDFKQCE